MHYYIEMYNFIKNFQILLLTPCSKIQLRNWKYLLEERRDYGRRKQVHIKLTKEAYGIRPIPTVPQLVNNFPTNGFPQLFSLQNYPMKSLMVKADVAQKEALSEWFLFCSITFFHKPFHERKGMLFFIINSSWLKTNQSRHEMQGNELCC